MQRDRCSRRGRDPVGRCARGESLMLLYKNASHGRSGPPPVKQPPRQAPSERCARSLVFFDSVFPRFARHRTQAVPVELSVKRLAIDAEQARCFALFATD